MEINKPIRLKITSLGDKKNCDSPNDTILLETLNSKAQPEPNYVVKQVYLLKLQRLNETKSPLDWY